MLTLSVVNLTESSKVNPEPFLIIMVINEYIFQGI